MVDSDFYKGVRFFRVIDGFMAQFVRSLLPAAPRAAAWKMCADSRVSGHPRQARDRGGVEGEDADGRPRRRVRPSLRSLRCSLAGGRPPPSDLGLRRSNKRSYVSFATSGKDSRTTQMFIKCAGPPTPSLRPAPLPCGQLLRVS